MVQEAKMGVRGLWNFPSGKLEPLEDVFTGAIREVKEETGYIINLIGL
jgi:8-oxo-dGTP pyrophosphatase MutT (NUDIX family)